MKRRPGGRPPGIEINPEVLRQTRLHAGLSLAQVGGRELTRQAVHLIETGKARPSWRSLRIIAKRLGVPTTALMAQPGPPPLAQEDRLIAEVEERSLRREWVEASERAQEIMEWGGSSRLLAFMHHYLGIALYHLGRSDDAVEHLEQARELFDLQQNPWFVAECLDWEAMALHLKDDPRALDVAEDALRRYRELEPRQAATEARMLEHVGTILQRRKDFESAREHYDRALDVAGNVRDLVRMGRINHGLAICFIGLGDRRRATDLLLKAISLYEAEHRMSAVPARVQLPSAENDLGMLYMELGDLERAEHLFKSALDHFAEAGADRLRSYVLLSLGDLHRRRGRLAAAFESVEQATTLAKRLKETQALAASYRQLGELHLELGEEAAAIEHLRTAIDICERAGLSSRRSQYVELLDRIVAGGRRAAGEPPAGA